MFRCYTPTEFALFGIGAIVMGVMLGVVGISWFKHQVSFFKLKYFAFTMHMFSTFVLGKSCFLLLMPHSASVLRKLEKLSIKSQNPQA